MRDVPSIGGFASLTARVAEPQVVPPRACAPHGACARPAAVRPRAVRWDATWKAAAVGAFAALPFSPVLGVVASATEAGLLAAIEARALSSLGVVGAPCATGASGGGVPWIMVRAGAHKALVGMAGYAARRTLGAGLKELGIALPRLAGRAMLGVAAPVASVAWSAAWNGIDMHHRLAPAVLAVEALEAAATLDPAEVDGSRALAPLAWGDAPIAAA